MIGCRGARTLLEPWVDGELVGDDRAVLESHLRACPSCRAAAEEEGRLQETLQAALPRGGAPPELRARVTAGMGQPPAASRRAWVAAAAVAAVGLALGFALAGRPGPPDADLVRLAADSHLRYGRGQLPLEVRSPRADEVSRFFHGRVPFDLVLPDHHPPEGGKPYVLEGGRLVALGDDYAAYVAYRLDDHPISLLVTSSDLARPAGGRVVVAGALEFHVVARAGLQVITWTDRGLTYALASDVSVDGARSCLVCHGSPAERRRLEGFKVPRT